MEVGDMAMFLVLGFVVMHLYFLYYVFTNVSMLWAVACVLLPILCLYIYYREWSGLRVVFFLQVGLAIAYFLVS
jgi:hypothetical protein